METIQGVSYADFLAKKTQYGADSGFEPSWLPDFLFDFQRHLVEWAVRKGRAAVYADCGLGKTPIAFAWGENVVRHANRPVLVVTTLGDSGQMLREAAKFQVEAVRSRDGKLTPGARLVVTNYERLHLFDPADFAGCVCNESSAIKDFDSRRSGLVHEFLRTLPYRLLCTATAAPNDWIELGTSSEALGELGNQDMLARFFKKHLAARRSIGWGHESYVLKGYAEQDFWRWVCSWARACRRPSDLGFADGPFVLPPLTVRRHEVRGGKAPGALWDLPAETMHEQRAEQRRTLRGRCEKAAELAAHGDHVVCWCHLNDEGDLLERLIPGAVQVSGRDTDDGKEEKLDAFSSGQIRALVTKPVIAGHGLNWQHCAHTTYFPGYSFERYYQCVHRFQRFGQVRPVAVDLVTTQGGEQVQASLDRKAAQWEAMFDRLVELMHQGSRVARTPYGTRREELPEWLSSTRF